MAVTLTTAARDAACDAITALIDAGGAGTLEFQDSGTTEVATCTFSATAFGASSTGVCTAAAITSDTNATGGTTVKALFKSGAGTEILRCAVGTSGSDINLSNNVITAGETVAITALTVTVPAS